MRGKCCVTATCWEGRVSKIPRIKIAGREPQRISPCAAMVYFTALQRMRCEPRVHHANYRIQGKSIDSSPRKNCGKSWRRTLLVINQRRHGNESIRGRRASDGCTLSAWPSEPNLFFLVGVRRICGRISPAAPDDRSRMHHDGNAVASRC